MIDKLKSVRLFVGWHVYKYICICHRVIRHDVKQTEQIRILTKVLSHWDRIKMAAILQTTFSNAFSWKCMNCESNFAKVCSRGLIDNIPAFVQIMAWCLPGDKPWSESMMVRLPTHICVTRPQEVKYSICSRNNFVICACQYFKRNYFPNTTKLNHVLEHALEVWTWHKMSCKISQCLEGVRSVYKIPLSLLLPRRLLNSEWYEHSNTQSRGFETWRDHLQNIKSHILCSIYIWILQCPQIILCCISEA